MTEESPWGHKLLRKFGYIGSEKPRPAFPLRQTAREQEQAKHGEVIAQLLKNDSQFARSNKPVPIVLDVDGDHPSAVFLGYSLAFWDIPWNRFTITGYSQGGPEGMASPEAGLFLTRSEHPHYLATYQVNGTSYYIYALPDAGE